MNIDLTIEEVRQPLPNFTVASAIEKVRKAEVVATAYSLDTKWRNRDTFIQSF